MGMDVYGKSGNYFRASVWSWPGIWTMVEHFVPDEITGKVQYARSNDGDGLDAEGAAQAALILHEADEQGLIEQYVNAHNAFLDAIPNESCRWCNGTGTRRDEVGVRLGMVERKWCNGCEGKGEHRPMDVSYGMDLEHAREFITFLGNSQGFEIW